MKYEIVKHSSARCAKTNAAVIEQAWLATSRWSDVVKWWKNARGLTRSIHPELYIDGKLAPRWDEYMSCAFVSRHTLRNYRIYLED